MQVKCPKTFSPAGTCSKEAETENIHSLDAVVSQICCSAKNKYVINCQMQKTISGSNFFSFKPPLGTFYIFGGTLNSISAPLVTTALWGPVRVLLDLCLGLY